MKRTIIALTAIMLLAGTAGAQRRSSSGAKTKYASAKNAKGSASKKKRRGAEEGKKFNISLGLSLAVSNTVKNSFSDAGGTATVTRSASAAGIFVYPKFHFYSTERFSISIGVPLTIAFSGSANSQTGTNESSTSFLYDLPLMIDYNGGVMAPANRYGEKKLGYFAGIGIGMENTDASYEYISNGYTGTTGDYTKAKSVGPNIHAGGVLRIGSENHPFFIGVRLSYKIGLNSDKFNYFTPSAFINF